MAAQRALQAARPAIAHAPADPTSLASIRDELSRLTDISKSIRRSIRRSRRPLRAKKEKKYVMITVVTDEPSYVEFFYMHLHKLTAMDFNALQECHDCGGYAHSSPLVKRHLDMRMFGAVTNQDYNKQFRDLWKVEEDPKDFESWMRFNVDQSQALGKNAALGDLKISHYYYINMWNGL